MTDLDIYQKQGFAGAIGMGTKPALVIVDFLIGFTDPAHFGGGNINEAIAGTEKLLAFARTKAWPIAHTRVVYADDGSDCGGFTRKVPALRRLTETSELTKIVPQLTPTPGELVVRKRNASAFFGTELVGWLAARQVDTLIVAGCTTSGCVRATVIDSCSHNFRTIVALNGVGDRAAAPHEANLFDMKQKYADLMTNKEIEAHS
jgi:maleamate amidohydrolase